MLVFNSVWSWSPYSHCTLTSSCMTHLQVISLLTHVDPCWPSHLAISWAQAIRSTSLCGFQRSVAGLAAFVVHVLAPADGRRPCWIPARPRIDRGYLALLMQNVLNSRFDVQNGLINRCFDVHSSTTYIQLHWTESLENPPLNSKSLWIRSRTTIASPWCPAYHSYSSWSSWVVYVIIYPT